MYERLMIIGAGGQGKVVYDIAQANGYGCICFMDDHMIDEGPSYPVVDQCDKINAYNDGRTAFFIAVGDNAVRRQLAERYNVPWATLIHPSAQIGSHVRIGQGTVIMAGAIVNACTTIGAHNIINSGAIVEHDNVLGDYVHVSPRAALGGTVTVGPETHIGIGAIVKNNVHICGKCMIGAGAVVVKDLTRPATYVGVPAGVLGESSPLQL